jgi:hypothetical protein
MGLERMGGAEEMRTAVDGGGRGGTRESVVCEGGSEVAEVVQEV